MDVGVGVDTNRDALRHIDNIDSHITDSRQKKLVAEYTEIEHLLQIRYEEFAREMFRSGVDLTSTNKAWVQCKRADVVDLKNRLEIWKIKWKRLMKEYK